MFTAMPALAQAPGSGPPLPRIVAPDAAGVDLLNGRRVGTDSGIAVGPEESPTLELNEGGGGLGGTPLGGFHYVDGAYPYLTDYFVLGNRGESNRFPDGTARSLPEGMMWQSNVLIERDGTRWQFAPTGRSDPYPVQYLTRLVRPDGESLTYNYSSVPAFGDIRGRLRSITSSAGYQINLAWTPSGVTYTLQTASLSNRRYAYCDPLSGACSDSSARPTMSWSTDASNTTTVTTSELRSVVYGASQQGPQGGEWTWRLTSGAGVSRTYSGGYSGPSSGAPLYYGRNYSPSCIDAAVVRSVRDAAGTWTYNYTNNCQGQLGTVTRTDPLGRQATRSRGTFTDELGRPTSYVYVDQWGNAVGPTGDARQVVGETFPEGNRVSWDYGSARNLMGVTVTPRPGTAEPTLSWSFGYPTNCTVATNINCHRRSYEIDPQGNRTDYTYDPVHGGVLTKTLPADANGVRPQIRYTYQQLSARVLDSSSALVNEAPIWRVVSTSQCRTQASCAGTADEVVTSYTYDDNLLPVTESVRAGDNSVSRTGTRTYDPVGNVVAVDGPLPGPADTTRYVYDRLRRLVATMNPDPDGGGPQPVTVIRTAYNGDNQRILVETGTAADQSDPALATMIVHQQLATVYDAAGRKARDTLTAGGAVQAVTQYSYDGASRLECTATRMNPAAFASLPASACALGAQGSFGPDRITRNVYDAAGQLTQVQRAYGTPLQQNEATYGYSANGRRTSVTDANGNRAELRYDGHDRQVRWVFPHPTQTGAVNEADYEAYGYDSGGNRTSLRKRDGVTLTYGYDALGRMTLKTVPASASGAPGYSVHYGYELGGPQLYARFGSPTGPGVTNAYDALGRPTAATTNMGGTSRTLLYRYDAGGRRDRITHPNTAFWSYEYDLAGRPTAIRENGNTLLAHFAYDALGRRVATNFPGATTSYGYDAVSRLSSIGYNLAGTSADQSLGFGYNPASQIVSRTSANDAYASNTAYPVSRAYAVNGLNQYVSAGPASFTYDANGNLRSDGATNFVYDAENRLVSASGGANASLVYDPLGRLFQTSGGSAGITQFLYDGDALVREFDSAGNSIRAFIHGADPAADDPLIWYEINAPLVRRSLFADHQGSIVAAMDGAAVPIAINAYDSWGIPNPANQGRFGYTGQVWIPELGLWYYKARFYSPTLGRFLQTDPIGYEGGMNLFAYADNDPVNGSDPFGLDNCRVLPERTKDCIGATQAEEDTEEGNRAREQADTIVVTARNMTGRSRSIAEHLADVDSPEWAFRVDPDGLTYVPFLATRDCEGNIRENRLSRNQFTGSLSGGHTHSAGYLAQPGPHDGNLAAVTGGGAYLITTAGRAVIERVGGSFRARLLTGSWGTSRENVTSLINQLNANPAQDGTDGVQRQCE